MRMGIGTGTGTGIGVVEYGGWVAGMGYRPGQGWWSMKRNEVKWQQEWEWWRWW